MLNHSEKETSSALLSMAQTFKSVTTQVSDLMSCVVLLSKLKKTPGVT